MGAIISSGSNSIFYKLVENTYVKDIYEQQWNVLPYTPDRKQTFVDFYPDLWSDTSDVFLRVFLNETQIARVKIVNIFGLIYCNIDVPYREFEIVVKSDDLLTIYKTYKFISLNLHLYYELLGEKFKDLRIENEKIFGDLYNESVRDEKIYDNFGSYIRLIKTPAFDYDEYRRYVLGNDTFIGNFKASLYGSTEKGIKEAIGSITEQYPTIGSQRDRVGWRLKENELYNHVLDSSLGNGFPLILDPKYKRFVIIIYVNNSTRNITNEEILMKEQDGTNYLLHNYLTSTIVTIAGYTENINFRVDRTNGSISWVSGQPQPVVGSKYYVNYSYYLKEISEFVANNIKPANIEFQFEYL